MLARGLAWMTSAVGWGVQNCPLPEDRVDVMQYAQGRYCQEGESPAAVPAHANRQQGSVGGTRCWLKRSEHDSALEQSRKSCFRVVQNECFHMPPRANAAPTKFGRSYTVIHNIMFLLQKCTSRLQCPGTICISLVRSNLFPTALWVLIRGCHPAQP